MSWERLTIVSNELEADMACGLLRDAGIECRSSVTDFAAGSLDGLPGPAGPREIVVQAQDLETARQLLADVSGT